MAKYEISGLQCDKPGCNYVDPSIKLEDYKSYINYPCPKCGSSLLTQADYDTVQRVIAVTESIPHDPNDKTITSFSLDGSGELRIKDFHENR